MVIVQDAEARGGALQHLQAAETAETKGLHLLGRVVLREEEEDITELRGGEFLPTRRKHEVALTDHAVVIGATCPSSSPHKMNFAGTPNAVKGMGLHKKSSTFVFDAKILLDRDIRKDRG